MSRERARCRHRRGRWSREAQDRRRTGPEALRGAPVRASIPRLRPTATRNPPRATRSRRTGKEACRSRRKRSDRRRTESRAGGCRRPACPRRRRAWGHSLRQDAGRGSRPHTTCPWGRWRTSGRCARLHRRNHPRRGRRRFPVSRAPWLERTLPRNRRSIGRPSHPRSPAIASSFSLRGLANRQIFRFRVSWAEHE